MKGTITLLSLLAILLLVIAFAGFGPAFATQLRACQGQGALSGPDAAGCLTAGGSPAVLGFALYLAGVVAALLAWLLGLLKTASIGRWGWFLLVLLLSPLGSLLYGLAGPATRAKA